MKSCPNCGNTVLEGELFCGSCGSKISEASNATASLKDPSNSQINEGQQPMKQGFPQQQPYQQPMQQGFPQQQPFQQPIQQGFPQQQPYQQPMQQGFPQQQPYQQPMQQGFPQQQSYQQPMQQGFPQQQPYQQPIQQGYPQQQPYQQPMQQGFPQQQPYQQPMQQGFPQQQPYQQPMQQGFPQQQPFQQPMQFPSTIAPGSPFIRVIWSKPQSFWMFISWIPIMNKLNISINGMTLTPVNGISLRKDFSIDIPHVSNYSKMESWLTTPLMKNKMSLTTKTTEVNLDSSRSYIIEIKPIFGFFWTGLPALIKFIIQDLDGNILLEK